jgi:hypothetical protein
MGRLSNFGKAVLGETQYQTFNNYLSNIVRKGNASVVGPSLQITGEFPEEVSFKRLYDFYHGWDQVKRSIDTMHQKFMGAGIRITSNSDEFDYFLKKWSETTNFQQKLSEFFLSVFITGNGIMELQYFQDGRIGNIEHIPMWTIYRVFRDEFARDIKIVQDIDGIFKELDPKYYVRWWINNPDRRAFGKSEFFSLAAPRKVAGTVDPDTGEAINPERNMVSLLDAQAILQNAEVEIKQLMAKPRIFASLPGMPQPQLEKLEKELQDPNSSKTIWAFDREAKMVEAQISNLGKFNEYGANVDNHIDIAFGFASKIISNPGAFSYSSSQTPLDVLDQRMNDLQIEAKEMIRDEFLRPLCESWNIENYDDLEVEVAFMPSVRRFTMEDIQKLPIDSVSPQEKRSIMKDLNVPLDDTLYEEFQQQQSALQPKPFGTDTKSFGQSVGKGGGQSPTSPTSPVATKAENPAMADEPENEQIPDAPKPMPQKGGRRRVGETLSEYVDRKVAEGVNDAVERIMQSPKINTSDLYTPGGLQDEETPPEITDKHVYDAMLEQFGSQDGLEPPQDEAQNPAERYDLPGQFYPEKDDFLRDEADPFSELGGDDGSGWKDWSADDVLEYDRHDTDYTTAYRGKNAPNPNDNYDITGPITNSDPQKTANVAKTVPASVNNDLASMLDSDDPNRKDKFRKL